MSVHQFTMQTITGEEKSLSEYKGRVLLLVNVASECGLTPQYQGLQELYEEYKESGLVVLGFPANEFGAQEPGTNEEIQEFCSLKFRVTFPMFSKIVVKGENIHPLYNYLTSAETNPNGHGEVAWNFQKYLIGKDGSILNTYHPKTEPLDDTLINDIKNALK